MGLLWVMDGGIGWIGGDGVVVCDRLVLVVVLVVEMVWLVVVWVSMVLVGCRFLKVVYLDFGCGLVVGLVWCGLMEGYLLFCVLLVGVVWLLWLLLVRVDSGIF